MKARDILKTLLLFVVLFVLVACSGTTVETPTTTSQTETEPATTETVSDEVEQGTEPVRIAALMTGPATVGAWNNTIYNTLLALDENPNVEIVTADNVDYANAAELARQYGDEGYDLVLGTSAGFEGALIEVAPEYDSTFFINYSDISTTNDLPNLAGYKYQYQEIGYLMGMTAALLSETNKLGIVSAVPVPALNNMIGGAMDGARSVDPDIEFLVGFTQSFPDLAKGKEIALAQISDGADMIVNLAGPGGDGAIEAACENGIPVTGYVVDQNELCPEQVVVSWVADHEAGITKIVNDFLANAVDPGIHALNVANNGLRISPFYNVPEDVQSQVMAAYDQIKSGELVIGLNPYVP